MFHLYINQGLQNTYHFLVYSKTNIKPEFLDGVLAGSIFITFEDVNVRELQLAYLNRKNMDNLRYRVVDFRLTSISLE